jgi:ferric-dicitrate binding protein FerR (iron transport regulator)
MSETDWELLDRYLSGEASPAERERVEAWLREDSERWAQLAALRDAIAKAALTKSAVDEAKAEIWARLAREIGETGLPSESAGRQGGRGHGREFAPSSGRSWFTKTQLAAALLLALVGGTTLGVLVLRGGFSSPAEAVHVATTGRGQRAMFRLTDGTRVLLGAASVLRYPAEFHDGSRAVSLEGEAYFDVVHDERRPFVVRAADLVAKDLGTEYTVRSYPHAPGARVVVREGRVAIRAAANGAGAPERVVAAGQLGRLGAGGEPAVEAADTAAWFAWTEGRLIFANTPLSEAVRQIERSRDVDIHLVPPEIGKRQFTTSFGDEPTSAILQVIGTGLRLDVLQTGARNYTLRAR